jgi:uncharacterized RDD family membrane protein YckC
MTSIPAPLKLRVLALLVDFVLVLVYIGILVGVALSFFYFIIGGIPTLSTNAAHAIGFLTLTLPVATYFILCELSQRHASFGKRKAKLIVSSFDGKPLEIKQVIVRNIIKFLPWEYAHTLIYILILVPGATSSTPLLFALIVANIIPLVYVCFVLFRRDHRGPHDLVSGTIVVEG